MNKKKKTKNDTDKFNNCLTELVETEIRLSKLPSLSEVDRAKLEVSRDIDHLYYSSKIEGSALKKGQLIRGAIYGENF